MSALLSDSSWGAAALSARERRSASERSADRHRPSLRAKAARRLAIVAAAAALLLAALPQAAAADTDGDNGMDADMPAYAMRWWNALTAEEMVAALYGTGASDAQAMAAKKMYADLDDTTRGLVNAAAKAIYGKGGFMSVGAWWESLDCKHMRIAAGDGNTADPMSKFCRHYPGSDYPAEKLLGAEALKQVDQVGMALLGRDDPGVYPPHVAYAMRWWNVLTAEEMVAALYGTGASDAQAMAAKKMYADLDAITRGMVNRAAKAIYGKGGFMSVGAWWESLDCKHMRIAAGDGNMADPMSKFCRHYPGSDFPAEKILSAEALEQVNQVGMALLGRDDPGEYPARIAYAMRWWNALTAEEMVAALYGTSASDAQAMAAKMMYADLDARTRGLVNAAAKAIYGDGGFASVGAWWESLDCKHMRIAAGDGNMADPMSAFCRHYPGSDFPPEKILSPAALAQVNQVGMALLGRDDAGTYPAAEVAYAMRWWNVLTPEEMVAALYGTGASDAQAKAAKMMYADLDERTRGLVNAAAKAIYGKGGFDSVGAWWESLDCKHMRIAAGDGNTADPMSPYCRHYPGSDFPPEKILGSKALDQVNQVGMALLNRDEPGEYLDQKHEQTDEQMDGDMSKDTSTDNDTSMDDKSKDKAMEDDTSKDMDGDKSMDDMAKETHYTVKPGDYLWKIAAMELGDGNLWRKIFDANMGVKQADGQALTDPNLLLIGWVLRIPAA
ncbi:LysM peptidoglycan-binding domain-containing protein [Candidatus Poriferisodalis sp.]|uniref:LysM peptidoglycan-binding domain-containing protein n=1 Tax=Candidatus Poriferisodalis sp. TaxID=3101277 RepID=UPI003B02A9F3